MLNEGTVLVYMRFNLDTWQLPYSSQAGGVFNVLDFLARPEILFITRAAVDNSLIAMSPGLMFRYVLIPGNVPAAVNLADYDAMQAFFGIPD